MIRWVFSCVLKKQSVRVANVSWDQIPSSRGLEHERSPSKRFGPKDVLYIYYIDDLLYYVYNYILCTSFNTVGSVRPVTDLADDMLLGSSFALTHTKPLSKGQ